MTCSNCGAELKPGAGFCEHCGTKTNVNVYDPATVPISYSYPEVTPTSVLTWGIVAAAFAGTFYLSFLGIIFGSVALKKSNRYLELYGPISKKVKIGHILSKVGIIAGIVMTAIAVICLIAVVVSALNY